MQSAFRKDLQVQHPHCCGLLLHHVQCKENTSKEQKINNCYKLETTIWLCFSSGICTKILYQPVVGVGIAVRVLIKLHLESLICPLVLRE